MPLRRFQREIRAAARLSHPNIVTAYDADEVDGTHFLVMEYVEGADLAELVARRRPAAGGAGLRLHPPGGLGLQHAHEQGLVHRDIKPSNLLLARKGSVVKVLDLGLARLHDAATARPTASSPRPASLVGTPDYIAPEQALDPHRSTSARTSTAWAARFYHLLAGRPPFPEGTVSQKWSAHQRVGARAGRGAPPRPAAGAGRGRPQADGQAPRRPLPDAGRGGGRPRALLRRRRGKGPERPGLASAHPTSPSSRSAHPQRAAAPAGDRDPLAAVRQPPPRRRAEAPR